MAEKKRLLPQDDPAQSQRFIEMAREVDANEDPTVFDRVFSRVVRAGKPKQNQCSQPSRDRDES